ncbi:MAG: 4a-hydroxytetrahydrobiopterin dehydratase [Flavobacteriales bacterium]|nr:4a-hydroxytetrahydrobiopterin dehydratase [Flavobacteriales bacterium]
MWKEEQGQLVQHFEFKDFVQAFDFLKMVADLAEEHGHHPEI